MAGIPAQAQDRNNGRWQRSDRNRSDRQERDWRRNRNQENRARRNDRPALSQLPATLNITDS